MEADYAPKTLKRTANIGPPTAFFQRILRSSSGIRSHAAGATARPVWITGVYAQALTRNNGFPFSEIVEWAWSFLIGDKRDMVPRQLSIVVGY